MIKLLQTVIVEGKYDKNKLKQIYDATIIETDGFGIFKDEKKAALIRKLAFGNGIIVFTDSDGAGFVIRNYIKNIAAGGKIYNAYIPNIEGKEKRKAKPSKECTLGVEGVENNVIIEAVSNALSGAEEGPFRATPKFTKADMYECGLSGKQDSSALRARLVKHFNLPEKISANGLLDVLNAIVTKDELFDILNRMEDQEQ